MQNIGDVPLILSYNEKKDNEVRQRANMNAMVTTTVASITKSSTMNTSQQQHENKKENTHVVFKQNTQPLTIITPEMISTSCCCVSFNENCKKNCKDKDDKPDEHDEQPRALNDLIAFKVTHHCNDTSNIFTFDNVIPNEICDYLIDFIDRSEKTKIDLIPTKNNVQCEYFKLDELIKHSVGAMHDECKNIDSNLAGVISMILNVLNSYSNLFKESKESLTDCGYTMRKIYGKTSYHYDGIKIDTGGLANKIRCMSLIIALNDDFVGGVFKFPIQKLSIKLKKGQALLFPPYWTHPHEVSSVGLNSNGDCERHRYNISTWLFENA